MNRKHFLKGLAAISSIPLGAHRILDLYEEGSNIASSEAPFQIPPFLKKGDTIGITSPAGFIEQSGILSAVSKLQEWGFQPAIGKTIGQRDFTFGGTDKERAEDFQAMLDDKNIKAILCARGGYGLVRIIDRLDFTNFRKQPKWIIGFSDITVLHSHVNSNFNIATIHSKMCNSFPYSWEEATEIQKETIDSIRDVLLGKMMSYSAPYHSANRPGTVQGRLTGGNLRTLETLAGTPSEVQTEGKILFVEDVGEYLYSIDRMFWNLKRSGKLDKLKGLIVGGFRIKPVDSEEEEFGKTLEEIVLEKLVDYDYPVCFNFPVGHQRDNFALKSGAMHELKVTESGTVLTSL